MFSTTDLTNATVQCGAGVVPTPTNTSTATPTRTLGVQSRTQAALYAAQAGIAPLVSD
jgi:hypothetical protein